MGRTTIRLDPGFDVRDRNRHVGAWLGPRDVDGEHLLLSFSAL
ncbi:MAG: hypothetical protein ACRDKT_10855 [Actinomycetota bacterium]